MIGRDSPMPPFLHPHQVKQGRAVFNIVLDPRNAIVNATALPLLFSIYIGEGQDYG